MAREKKKKKRTTIVSLRLNHPLFNSPLANCDQCCEFHPRAPRFGYRVPRPDRGGRVDAWNGDELGGGVVALGSEGEWRRSGRDKRMNNGAG